MKESELRIGSTYWSVKFRQPVTLTAEDIAELVHRAEGASIESYISEMFEPILLTEDELVRFKEVKHEELDGGAVGYYDSYSVGLYDLAHVYKNKWSIIGVNMDTIDYVHEFQNIYYALKRKELTLK